MGVELGPVSIVGGSVSRSSAKSRSLKAQISDGDIEENAPLKSQSNSTGSVLPYVGVASLGAILFGYHLGVVNGALEYLAKDLGIVENTVLQGWLDRRGAVGVAMRVKESGREERCTVSGICVNAYALCVNACT